MANELGAGSGSGYPAAIDTDSTVESTSTTARADVPNDLADAIIAIETELGVDPAGSSTDVVTRLNANDTLTGALAGKNMIINGDMDVWQRGTSFATATDGSFCADRWKYIKAGTAVHTLSKATDVPTIAEAGRQINYSIKADVTTADAAVAATAYVALQQNIEGYNFRRAAGQACKLSFWVKAAKTGIHCVSFQSSTADGSQVAEYTISSAATWEFKEVPITFDYGTVGTWLYTNGIGCKVNFTLSAGANYQGTKDQWNAANDLASASVVNETDNAANNFYLAGVQLEVGSTTTPFEYVPFPQLVAQCERYYQKSYNIDVAPATDTDVGLEYYYASGLANVDYIIAYHVTFNTKMRTTPTTITTYDLAEAADKVTLAGGNGKAATINNEGATGCNVQATNGGASAIRSIQFHYTADAEL